MAISRRSFVEMSALAGTTIALTACGGSKGSDKASSADSSKSGSKKEAKVLKGGGSNIIYVITPPSRTPRSRPRLTARPTRPRRWATR
ncbi:hypothetical protein [Parafannyhessea umbonata]|uniref:hypothetical protein n=1 Tax=Parafannyhessea umbonata TaxID=604330 RepID=UPI0018D39C98|nr:hypothetical protein [Parafannyhessea umbonata]